MAEPLIVSRPDSNSLAGQQAQLYYKDGTPIAPADVRKALDAGEAFTTGEHVNITDAQGRSGTVSAGGLANTVAQQGAHVENRAEARERGLRQDAESLGGMARTGVDALQRGATLGFGGPEQFADDDQRAAILARMRANPKLAAGGEVAGMLGAAVAASFLTGGAAAPEAGEGVAARLAALAGRGALTPFRAATALGDAAEGLIGGQGVLARGAALGLRGAAEGAVFGAGHEVSQAALDNVPLTAERLLAGAWDGAKMGGAFGAGLGVLGAGVGKAGRAIVGRMAETGEEMGAATGTWAERAMGKQVLGNNAKIWRKATSDGADMARPARIGRKMLDADMPTATGPALRRAQELADEAVGRMQAVAQVADDAGVLVKADRILSSVDDQIAKLKETPFGDFQSIAARVEKEIAPFRAKYASVPGVANDTTPTLKFSDLWGLRKKLDDVVYREGAARGPAKEALTEMRDAFRRELDSTIEEAAATSGAPPQLLGAWKKATEDYSDFALVKQSLKELSNRQSKNRALSPTDYGTGSAAGILMGILSGNPITGLAVSAATSAAHKLIRERGAGVLAKIADRTGGVAGKMEMAGKVAAMVEAPKNIAIPAAVNVTQQFKRYSDLVNQANAEPAKFADRVASATADLSLRFPEVAQQVQMTMMGDLAYLNQLHPQPASRKNATLTPMAIKPAFYAFNQQKAFVDAATALDNPLSVFEDIARGELPLIGIDALKARRPALFQEMRQTVVKYTMTREEELPFSRRMLLGVAFDFPADWSMQNVSAIQASLAPPAPPSPNNPKAAPSKLNKDPGADIAPGGF